MSTTITNEEKWFYLLKDVESPEIYIKAGFYFLIAAALQRRVWIPFGTSSLYPNMYVIFVGPPSIGKGRVIVPVCDLLKTPKRSLSTNTNVSLDLIAEKSKDKIDKEEIEELTEIAKKEAATDLDNLQLFPILPDSTSLRSLTSFVAKSFRTIRYKDIVNGKVVDKVYGHSSCAFILEELSDLLKDSKETKDLCRFLNRAWDCGDFKHETYHNGKDEIKLMCVSLLAGTTQEGMRDFFSTKILNEGFSSRTLFIWSDRNRFYRWNIGELNQTQLQYKRDLINHLYKLSTICGRVELSPNANSFIQDWYENKSMLPAYRINHNYRLESYYGRKRMHIMKIAMAMHFAESTSMVIDMETIQKAMEFLESIERNMHIALSLRGRNELHPIGIAIVHYIRKYGQKSTNEIFFEFAEDIKDKIELQNILSFLVESKQLVVTGNKSTGELVYGVNQQLKKPTLQSQPPQFVEGQVSEPKTS